MNRGRRNLVIGTAVAGALGAAAYASRSLRRAEPADPRPLAIPPLLDARVQRQSIALRVQASSSEFFPGRESATFGYNGAYLGPTLRLYRADNVEVTVANNLGEPTTVHWHGLLVAGELDGGPHQLIRVGETWRPILPVRQPAAMLFYHSHVHGRTAEQVYRGLAGVLILADEEERALALPREYGVDDLPLVIQDRQFEDNGPAQRDCGTGVGNGLVCAIHRHRQTKSPQTERSIGRRTVKAGQRRRRGSARRETRYVASICRSSACGSLSIARMNCRYSTTSSRRSPISAFDT